METGEGAVEEGQDPDDVPGWSVGEASAQDGGGQVAEGGEGVVETERDEAEGDGAGEALESLEGLLAKTAVPLAGGGAHEGGVARGDREVEAAAVGLEAGLAEGALDGP